MRAVLLTIADAANRDGAHAHPGLDAMVEGSLYSRRQVIDTAGELVAEGWAVVEQAGGGRARATVYAVPMVQPPHCLPADTVQSTALNGAVAPPQTVQFVAETVHPGVHPNGLTTVKPNGKAQRAVAEVHFPAFWEAYPRRVGRGDAAKAWAKAVAKADPEVIIQGAARYAADPNRAPEYTAHPATWLNGERWADDPLPARAGQQGGRRAQVDTDRNQPGGVLHL
jgi:hypothetical protein